VKGLCLWARPPKPSAIEIIGAALYMLFDTVHTLKINYRQRSPAGAQLALFLEGMRNGVLNSTDYVFLLSRSRERGGEVAWAAAAETAIHLYPTNEQVHYVKLRWQLSHNDNDILDQVDEHNTAKLHELSESTGTAIAMIR
jgi:hypothetical protein